MSMTSAVRVSVLVVVACLLLTRMVDNAPAPCKDSCQGKNNGQYQSCEGCNKFVSCSNQIVYTLSCAADLVWDDTDKTCVYNSTTCSE